MNRDETLALWEQGPEAWNAWAREMLNRPDKGTGSWTEEASADFRNRTFNGDACFFATIFPGPAYFASCIFEDTCDFRLGFFHDQAQFSGTHFRGDALFMRAKFLSQVIFHMCSFHRDASFEEVRIKSILNLYKANFLSSAVFNRAKIDFARFQATRFSEQTLFIGTHFCKSAVFDGSHFFRQVDFRTSQFRRSATFRATFQEEANFAAADFNGATSFRGSTFLSEADFRAAKSERNFDMAGATFEEVPNFIQTHFAEAPRLDNVTIHRRRGPEAGKDGDELPARWRALKRLALQGHDHVREQEYFAEELLALRGNPDKLLPDPRNWFRPDANGQRKPIWPGGGRYWLGLLYQGLSNFGRSASRPLLWWITSSLVFAFLYLKQHFSASARTRNAYDRGPGEWLWAHAGQQLDRVAGSSEPSSDVGPFPIACIRGEGSPLWEAIGLSLNKSLPFTGVGSPEKLNQIYACLYGIQSGGTGELPDRFIPVIPDLVYFVGIAQTLFSLVLIFLFLLALRNHFRIR